MVPPDLMPEGLVVVIPRPPPAERIGKKPFKSTNWPPELCVALSNIICLPVFKDDIKFLRYVLKLAVTSRVGTGLGPDLTYCGHDTPIKLLAEVKEKVVGPPLNSEQMAHLTKVLASTGDRLPEHWGSATYILKYTKKEDLKKTSGDELCGLKTCDLRLIEKAWNEYVKEEQPSLRSVFEYVKACNKEQNIGYASVTSPDQGTCDSNNWKKEWILSVRRQDILRKRGSDNQRVQINQETQQQFWKEYRQEVIQDDDEEVLGGESAIL